MAELSPEPGREPHSSGLPRWVKVFGLITIAVLVLLVVLLIAGSDHGPGRHSPSGAGPTPSYVAGSHITTSPTAREGAA
jgi:hypothetical protein